MAEAQVLSNYKAGPVERFGRRLKMEYVGMASVFAVIALLIFDGLAPWYRVVAAMLGTYGLFMGIKKKTRDHLCASLLMFSAAFLARGSLLEDPRWALPYLFFGAMVLIMEGFLEKLQNHVYALPVLFGLWAAVDLSWVLGMVFMAIYLPQPPPPERAEWRPRFFKMAAVALVVALVVAAVRFQAASATWAGWPASRLVPDRLALGLLLGMGVPVLVALAIYWRRLLGPHRIAPLVFAALAPWDIRLIAFFGLVGAVLLSATFLRQSIDSVRLRPFFKHAEWHFFWWVLAAALWAGFLRP